MGFCSDLRNGDLLVLFVDDDPEVRELFIGALRDAGFLVDECVTPKRRSRRRRASIRT